MKINALCKRNLKEILRDPLSLILGIVFPSVLLILFVLIDTYSAIPIHVFSVSSLTPGMIVFGFCFLMMFSALFVAKDRRTSLFDRFQTLPLRPSDFILSYSLPYLVFAMIQIIVTYSIGFILGLPFTWGILISIPFLIPMAFIFIALGIMMGASLNEGQISGIGTLFINLATLFSGAWFDYEIMGGFVKTFCLVLPFARAVSGTRELISGQAFNFDNLYVLLAYAIVVCFISFLVFYIKLKGKTIHSSIKKQKDK